MLDIAWPELVVIGAVALVAIGPKDLPKVLYQAGRWIRRARQIMGDVHRSFDQLSYEAEIADQLKANTTKEPKTPSAPQIQSTISHEQ